MKQINYTFLSIAIFGGFMFASSFLIQCATPGSLDGGPRDETPPQLDTLNSTPNFQTNFKPTTIELIFDEWLKLNDVFNQVVISPPLEKRPDVSLQRKSVIVDFSESGDLRENATYVINFGEAIQDFTEGNAPENLKFVFSTGDYIDSLTINGKVIDAITKEPKEEVLVMLYDNLSDTVVSTERPFYFSRTDEQGRFKITNIRADTFKLFALLEQDLNYLYNQPGVSEEIAFPDSFIVVNDSLNTNFELLLFKEKETLQLLSVEEDTYGLLKLIYNQPPTNLTFRYESNLPTLLFDYEKDSLKIWYDFITADSSQITVKTDSLTQDTFYLNASKKADFLDEAQLRLVKKLSSNTRQHPEQAIELFFNYPISDFDTSLIRLLEDTTLTRVQADVSIDSTTAYRKMQIDYNWKEGVAYELLVEPNAVRDIYGLSNQDTLQSKFEVQLLKDFGNILLTLNQLDSLQTYTVELWEGDQTKIASEMFMGVTKWEKKYATLSPKKYKLRFITDVNQNGQWDTGSYSEQRQAEPIQIEELEALRANWDLVVEFALKN